MSYYGYQYKQQCFIPGGLQSRSAALPQPCPGPGLPPCSSCSPCGPIGRALPGPGCLETRVVEGHRCSSSSSSSSCSGSRCLGSCPAAPPQPPSCARCPQVCQDSSSCPYSYQWANSYQYKCGH